MSYCSVSYCIILYRIVSLYTIQNIVFYLYEIDTKYCIDFVLYCIALHCIVLFFNELNCIFLHFSVFLSTFLKLDSVTKQMNIKWVNIVKMVSWTVTWHMLRWSGLHTYWECAVGNMHTDARKWHCTDKRK